MQFQPHSKPVYHPFIFFLFFTMFLMGCGSDTQNDDAVSEKTGAISLRISISRPSQNTQTKATDDICDYDISTIHAVLYDDNGSIERQARWDCNTPGRSGTLDRIRQGKHYRLEVSGESSTGAILWSDEVTGIGINSASPTMVSIALEYQGTDRTPPQVKDDTEPADNEEDVSINTAVTATFTEPVVYVEERPTITNENFTLTNLTTSTQVECTVVYNPSNLTVTLQPTAGETLSENTTYEARIFNYGNLEIEDMAGNVMLNEKSWRFTTASSTDPETEPPAIRVPTIPENGASNVAPDAVIQFTFSEPMNRQTIESPNITLLRNTETDPEPVQCDIQYDPLSHTVSLSPTQSLRTDSIYTVKVSTNVTDATGINMASDATWQFSTVSTPILNEPTVSSNEVQFSWSSTNAEAYEMVLLDNLNANDPIAAFTVTTSFIDVPTTTLTEGAQYYWQVTAHYEAGVTVPSPISTWLYAVDPSNTRIVSPLAPDGDNFAWQNVQTRFLNGNGSACSAQVTMAMGDQAFCYVANNGEMMCAGRVYETNWGPNFVGTGEMEVEQIMIRPTSNVSNGNGMCILKNGQIYCMGENNNSGQYGTGDTVPVSNLTLWGYVDNIYRFATGTGDSYCALTYDADVYCSGYDYGYSPTLQASALNSIYIDTFGQLQIDAPGVWRASQVRAECTLRASGLDCHGATYGPPGQIVDGGIIEGPSYEDAYLWLTTSGQVQCSGCSRIDYFAGEQVIAIAYDRYSDSICAACNDGSIWCVGSNRSGKLGTGDDADVTIETMVAPPGSIQIQCSE